MLPHHQLPPQHKIQAAVSNYPHQYLTQINQSNKQQHRHRKTSLLAPLQNHRPFKERFRFQQQPHRLRNDIGRKDRLNIVRVTDYQEKGLYLLGQPREKKR